MAENDEPSGQTALLRVLDGMLRPLVRVLIARGITLPVLYRLLKATYVAVARQDFRIDGVDPTDSRISVLTGVHRRDVRTIRAAGGDLEAVEMKRTTLLATVVGRWLAGPETLDQAGQPLALPRTAQEGPSFEALVAGINNDVRPRTVLDELLRQDLVRDDPETGLLSLHPDAVVGAEDLDQKILFFAANVGDHLGAAAQNLLEPERTTLERAVFYNRLRPASVEEVEALARELGQSALLRLNREARQRQDRDSDAPEATHRFRFGIYFYREDRGRDDKDDNA